MARGILQSAAPDDRRLISTQRSLEPAAEPHPAPPGGPWKPPPGGPTVEAAWAPADSTARGTQLTNSVAAVTSLR